MLFFVRCFRAPVSETPTSWLLLLRRVFQAKYEALVKLTDSRSKSALLSVVRTMVFGLRGELDVASDRLQRAIDEGECAEHHIITAVGLLRLNQCGTRGGIYSITFGVALPSLLTVCCDVLSLVYLVVCW